LFTWKPPSTGGALEIDTRAVISRLTTSPKAFQRLKLGPGIPIAAEQKRLWHTKRAA
jgi:hypothetical protein